MNEPSGFRVTSRNWMISGSPFALMRTAALAPFSISSWVTDSRRSSPVVMNRVRALVSSVAKGDGGSPRALAAAPQAASLRAIPARVQELPSALL